MGVKVSEIFILISSFAIVSCESITPEMIAGAGVEYNERIAAMESGSTYIPRPITSFETNPEPHLSSYGSDYTENSTIDISEDYDSSGADHVISSTDRLLAEMDAQNASAFYCVSYERGSPEGNAFFKGRLTNNCLRPVWVSWCENSHCSRKGYRDFDSSEELSPGSYTPVDTEGEGIDWGACFYSEPNWYTPEATGVYGFECS